MDREHQYGLVWLDVQLGICTRGGLITVLTEVVSELLNNSGGLAGLDGLVVLSNEHSLSSLHHDNTSSSLLACDLNINIDVRDEERRGYGEEELREERGEVSVHIP